MPIADVNGLRIHHRLEGAPGAPVLVLSSSLGTDLGLWDGQVPALASRYRVLRYDMRGHGASQAPPGPYSVAALARDVLGLLDALGVVRALFCGISLGGMVGQWLGMNAPERVAALVLANTSARLGPPEAWDARIAAVRAGGMESVAGAVLARWFTPGFRDRRPDEVDRVRRMLLATPPEGYAAACAAVRDMDHRASVGRIGAPTLVVSGAADPSTPPAEGRFLAERIPGARHVELDAAHLSNVEAPQAFLDAVLPFLEEHALEPPVERRRR